MISETNADRIAVTGSTASIGSRVANRLAGDVRTDAVDVADGYLGEEETLVDGVEHHETSIANG